MLLLTLFMWAFPTAQLETWPCICINTSFLKIQFVPQGNFKKSYSLKSCWTLQKYVPRPSLTTQFYCLDLQIKLLSSNAFAPSTVTIKQTDFTSSFRYMCFMLLWSRLLMKDSTLLPWFSSFQNLWGIVLWPHSWLTIDRLWSCEEARVTLLVKFRHIGKAASLDWDKDVSVLWLACGRAAVITGTLKQAGIKYTLSKFSLPGWNTQENNWSQNGTSGRILSTLPCCGATPIMAEAGSPNWQMYAGQVERHQTVDTMELALRLGWKITSFCFNKYLQVTFSLSRESL